MHNGFRPIFIHKNARVKFLAHTCSRNALKFLQECIIPRNHPQQPLTCPWVESHTLLPPQNHLLALAVGSLALALAKPRHPALLLNSTTGRFRMRLQLLMLSPCACAGVFFGYITTGFSGIVGCSVYGNMTGGSKLPQLQMMCMQQHTAKRSDRIGCWYIASFTKVQVINLMVTLCGNRQSNR